MSPTAFALLGYIAWALIILVMLAGLRTSKVMSRQKAPNSFSPLGDDVGDFGKRLTRVHANCYENLAIAASLMLYAIATGQTAATDSLAYIFLAARVGQSVVHLMSTSNNFVRIRFFLFVAQNLILVFWVLKLFGVF